VYFLSTINNKLIRTTKGILQLFTHKMFKGLQKLYRIKHIRKDDSHKYNKKILSQNTLWSLIRHIQNASVLSKEHIYKIASMLRSYIPNHPSIYLLSLYAWKSIVLRLLVCILSKK